MELDTPRLRLRAWRDADRAPFAAMNADPRVMAHFPALWTRAQSDAAIDRWQAQLQRNGWTNWALEPRSHSAFMGFVGLNVPANPMPFSPCVEVGWRLRPEYWGEGHATEAARAALQAAFGPFGLEQVVSFTALSNERSQAVMQRLGMRRDEDFEHPGLPPGHRLRPHALYRMDRARWLDLQDRPVGATPA